MIRTVFSILTLFHAVALADEWRVMPVPAAGGWEKEADGVYADHDGFAWYRAYVEIPAGARIGYDPDEDRRRHTVSDDGIVVVTPGEECALAEGSS